MGAKTTNGLVNVQPFRNAAFTLGEPLVADFVISGVLPGTAS